MQSANDIFLHTLSERYFAYLATTLNTSLSAARDREYALSEFALKLDKTNYEAGKHIFHEELIKQFLHHYRMGLSVDATLQAVASLQANFIYADEPKELLCCKGERSVLKFLAKYAAIERMLIGIGYREDKEQDEQRLPVNGNTAQEPKKDSPLPQVKVKRVKGDQLTRLSQEETALFGFLAQAERVFLSAEFLSKVTIGTILEAATGYSGESIRKSLSELPGSRDKTVREMYQHIKEVLASMQKRIDKELGE